MVDNILLTLVNLGLLSQAQAELAKRDSETASMEIEEVLLARHWVTEDLLKQHGLLKEETPEAKSKASGVGENGSTQKQNADQVPLTDTTGSCDDYGFNLSRYRAMMREILD